MATNIKIDRLETSFDYDAHSGAFTTTVFATNADTLEPVVFEVNYSNPDDLLTAIVAGPTVDGGEIVDFLP